jgi:cyclophilin family peptidyl-prolyl cis-trans isomerase
MNKLTNLILITAVAVATTLSSNAIAARPNPVVKLTTTYGEIEIELYRTKAPVSVKNFMGYVHRGHYNDLIFHRVIKGFMIQSGGFKPGMRQIPPARTIQNEADNGLKNEVGTFAMARTNEPHSAGAQFFINTNNNANLDHRGKTDRGWGYAVFGKVTKGMQTVRRIEATPTHRSGYYSDVPVKDIVILKASVVSD